MDKMGEKGRAGYKFFITWLFERVVINVDIHSSPH